MDTSIDGIRASSGRLRRIDLGRTRSVDHLVLLYDGSRLVSATAEYIGYTSTLDTFYVLAADPETVVVDEILVTEGNRTSSRHYFIGGKPFAVREGGTIRAATSSDDLYKLYKVVETTANRASRGESVSDAPMGE